MTGRPSKRTPEIEQKVIDGLADGVPLRETCRAEGMPHYTTFYDWIAADPDLALRIARAREAGFDALAYDGIRIADDGSNDTVIDQNGNPRPNTEWIARSKLRVETRFKLLSKWDPKRYGDAINLKHSDPEGKPMQAIINVTIGWKKPDGG